MAQNLKNHDAVWHPAWGIRIVIELEDEPDPDDGSVLTIGVDDLVQFIDGAPYIRAQDLRRFSEHNLARVGEG